MEWGSDAHAAAVLITLILTHYATRRRRPGANALSGLAPRPHVTLEHSIDPRLVAFSGGFEIGQHGAFDTHGDLHGAIGFDEFCPLPEGFVQLGNIAEVYILVFSSP